MAAFDFSADYTLENEVALLRPLVRDDHTKLLHFALTEPDLWTYSMISAAGSDALKNYVEYAIVERESHRQYPFVVFDKRVGQYAGCTRYYDIRLAEETLQLGYTWYGKQFQRTGLNRHCKYLMLQFAFERMDMQRVEFRADNDNHRSIAAMKAIGCHEEGILRSNGKRPDGSRRDSIVLSILRDEWFNTVKASLNDKIY